MRYTVNLDCKTHYISKDGTVPLTLRVSVNGEHDYLNTGKRIKIDHYDTEAKALKPGFTGYGQLDAFITRQKKRIDEIIEAFEKRNEVATISKVKDLYAQETGKVKSSCFFQYVEEKIKWEREHSEITDGTLDNYEAHLKKLKDFRNKLSIHDIDTKFLEKYRSHILDVLKQSQNTAYHAMCFLRKYTKQLFEAGKLSPYPFAKFKVGGPFEVEIEYLEPEELTKLHDLYDSGNLKKIVRASKSKHCKYKEFELGEKLHEVLRYFLVACYTGLRHSDVKTLKREHIKGRFIVKEMVKGREGRKKTVRVPIRKRLLSLLDINSEVLFENPVMEDSQTNKYLALIMQEAGINKHITFHCARHSFAIISLLLGIKIEVVSDILGHSELTTTQRYAKVVDRLREQEMDKWDKMAKEEFNTGNLQEIVCPGCENTVLRFEKGVIALNKIPVICPYCATSFSHNINSNRLEVSYSVKAG